MPPKIEDKLMKYFDVTAKALKKVKFKEEYKKQAEDLLDLSKRYYSDAKHFESVGDLVNAFGAVCYARAFLDVGARLGFFDVDGDNELFMVD